MVIDAFVHYPTLTYLPLRDDQVRSYFSLQRGQYDHIVVEAVDGFKWNLLIQCVKLTTPRFGFTGQWEEMTKNYKLAVNDYLVFQRIQGTWTFRMYVFDNHGIERVNFNDDLVYTGPDLHPEIGYVPMVIEIESDDEPQPHNVDEGLALAIEDDVGMLDVEEPVLDIIVPQLHEHNILEVIVRDRLRLPVEFARNNNLDAKVQFVLINPNGVDVETKIAIELNGYNERYRVRNWTNFVPLNGLQYGTLVVFEYNEPTHSLILTDVLG